MSNTKVLNKEDKLFIKNLKKQKDYLGIYDNYGKDIYKKKTTRKQRKTVNKELAKEFDVEKIKLINNKKDARYYINLAKDKRSLKTAKYKVIAYAKYPIRRFMHKPTLRNITIGILVTRIAYIGLMSNLLRTSFDKDRIDIRVEHAVEINEYERQTDLTAKKINSKDYSKYLSGENEDFVKIIDVTKDLWENQNAVYGKPELDYFGYGGLDFSTDDPTGVCRNFVDDIVNKMNKINPEYNARPLYCDLKDGDIDLLDIDRTFNVEESSGPSYSIKGTITASHVIIAFNMPGYDDTLIFDPTNPSFGIIYNGKIINFNSESLDKPLEYKIKKIADYEMAGKESHLANLMAIRDSYFIGKKDYEMYKELFGIEAQERVLDGLREMDKDLSVNKKVLTNLEIKTR